MTILIELVPYRGNVVVSELLTGFNDYSRADRILDNSTQNIKCSVNYLRIGFILSYTFISLGGKVNTVMRVGGGVRKSLLDNLNEKCFFVEGGLGYLSSTMCFKNDLICGKSLWGWGW